MSKDKSRDDKKPKGSKSFKATTPTKRFFKLAGMSTSIASTVAGNKVKGVFASEEQKKENMKELAKDIGEQIAETLGEMKGAVMKVGQLASQIQDLLPPELTEALAKLQKESPPMPYGMIRKQIIDACGSTPEKLFAEFDETPFAAASIGQVHRAKTLDGQEVIVKVQYPGVEESCESDLKQIKRLLKLAGLVKMDPEIVDEMFREIKDSLKEELDYLHEAKNVDEFYEHYKDHDDIIIPKVIHELTNKKVLTLTFEPGDHLDNVKAPAYSQETINKMGHRLFIVIIDQIFDYGAVHCDPHPGNFAFRPDGSIIIYDFGSVKRVEAKVVEDFKIMIGLMMNKEYDRMDECMLKMGFRKEGTRAIDPDFYAQWMDLIHEPFGQDKPYDFGEGRIHKDMIKVGKSIDLFEYMDLFQPSPDTFGIERVFNGHYWTLVSMGVVTSFYPEVNKRMQEWGLA